MVGKLSGRAESLTTQSKTPRRNDSFGVGWRYLNELKFPRRGTSDVPWLSGVDSDLRIGASFLLSRRGWDPGSGCDRDPGVTITQTWNRTHFDDGAAAPAIKRSARLGFLVNRQEQYLDPQGTLRAFAHCQQIARNRVNQKESCRKAVARAATISYIGAVK